MGTDIHIAVEVRKEDGWHLSDLKVTQDRNYRAFAVLADVRNGYSFGGFSTGEALQPISEPRGLPEDMSPELRTKLDLQNADDGGGTEFFWLGDHSFSWVTMKELLEYDLDAPVFISGYVSNETARRYRETGETPRSFAAWTPLPNFERMEWQEPTRQAAWLISVLIEEISPLGEPQNVRLVFGFDN
jgi:hypothetical protein